MDGGLQIDNDDTVILSKHPVHYVKSRINESIVRVTSFNLTCPHRWASLTTGDSTFDNHIIQLPLCNEVL